MSTFCRNCHVKKLQRHLLKAVMPDTMYSGNFDFHEHHDSHITLNNLQQSGFPSSKAKPKLAAFVCETGHFKSRNYTNSCIKEQRTCTSQNYKRKKSYIQKKAREKASPAWGWQENAATSVTKATKQDRSNEHRTKNIDHTADN